MPKKAVISLGLAAAAIIAIALFTRPAAEPALAPASPPTPTFTEDQARILLASFLPQGCEAQGVDGSYRSCTFVVVQDGDLGTATVTDEVFFDESVRASRIIADFDYKDGAWGRVSMEETYRCQPGRGHEEFGSELCV